MPPPRAGAWNGIPRRAACTNRKSRITISPGQTWAACGSRPGRSTLSRSPEIPTWRFIESSESGKFMRRFLLLLCCVLVLCFGVRPGAGFSLVGPSPAWQTTAIGYQDFTNLPNDPNTPAAGPMNLGEGYRWNIPTIFYSYSPDFLHYFGARGAQEIDKAIQILNSLPSMDSVTVDNFPLQSQRINYRAAALGLSDLKSWALSSVLHDLGLTDPTRYVFTLRNRFVVGASTNYYVVRRNFDPVTFDPSPFINGQ